MHIQLKNSKAIIGMIHVDPLPGTPKYTGDMHKVIAKAREEALLYRDAGIDMLAIENMHDIPYLNRDVGPEIVAAMTAVGNEVKKATGLPGGIQILAGANMAALAAAHAAGLDFIRAEGFVFSHVADEGLIDADAGPLMRFRTNIGAGRILVLTDIKKKHASHALTSDISIEDTARAAAFFLSDGVIVTGDATGREAAREDVRGVKAAVDIPVLVGSGITIENVERYLPVADALIVGSYFKQDGHWASGVDRQRVSDFMARVRELRP